MTVIGGGEVDPEMIQGMGSLRVKLLGVGWSEAL